MGCTPIKLKHHTTKGNKIIIIQNGKLSPKLLLTKFWISEELVNIDPKNIDTEINNISSPEFWIKFFKFLKMKFDVSGRLNIWIKTRIGTTIIMAFNAVLLKIWPTNNTDTAKINNLENIGLIHHKESKI